MHKKLALLAFGAVVAIVTGCGNTSTTPVVAVPTTATIFYSHSIAFRNNTTLTWGYNGFGQLGINPATTSRAVPRAVPGLGPVDGFSAGADHSVAFMNNSTVRAWGFNNSGQLGKTVFSPGTATAQNYSFTPVKVGDLHGVIAVSAGGDHTLALRNDGTVWAWGSNASGELGNGTLTSGSKDRTAVVEVLEAGGPLSGITKIAAGGVHSLALQDVGGVQTLYAWGSNANGQLGSPKATLPHSSQAVIVNGITGTIVAIAAGGSYSLALTDDGRVWAWGYNGFGQLGVAAANLKSFRETPGVVKMGDGTDLTGITHIVAGLDHVAARAADGTVWTWGFNRFGQLGNGTTTDSFSPVQVMQSGTAFGGVVDFIPVKGNHTIVRRTDRSVWAWGENAHGQLGDRTTVNRAVPVPVVGF